MLILALVVGCVMWAVAYLIIVLQSFRRNTYGMALAPVCCNLGWDVTFAFVLEHPLLWEVPAPFYDPKNMDLLIQSFCTVWALADVLMLWQLAWYGRGDTLRHGKPGAFALYAGVLALGALCLVSMSREVFRTPSAHFMLSGMGSTLCISVSYLRLALAKVNLRGHSLMVAVLRLLGIELVCLALNGAVGVLPPLAMPAFMTMFVILDGLYILLLIRWCREEHSSVWPKLRIPVIPATESSAKLAHGRMPFS
jgi:hypothetical protein